MAGRLGLGTLTKKDRWKKVCERKRIVTLRLGPLLDFLGCEKGIYEGIWCRARVSTSPRLMEKRKRERERSLKKT